MASPRTVAGFSLLELLIAMFLSALLLSGVTYLLSSSVFAYRQQLGQGHMDASSRYVHEVLNSHITQAGYHPRPWQETVLSQALSGESLERTLRAGDQLGLQRYSANNCYGNDNPAKDTQGRPAFHLQQVRFHVTPANSLAMTCRYGPGVGQMTTQINNFGLAEQVESMQVLYAEDRSNDGIADGWVHAGDWQQESDVLAVKVALLFVSDRPFNHAKAGTMTLLDETLQTPADGRLRKVTTMTAGIRGRL